MGTSKVLNVRDKTSVLLFLFITILFFVSNPNFESVEKNIYLHYTNSFVDDFDLNLVNQVPKKELWQVTKTYNYPDMHSNGIVSLWTPFFIFKKFLSNNVDQFLISKLLRTVASYFFGFLNLILIFKCFRRFWPESNLYPPLIIMTFVTSYFWYSILQTGNADITLSFFTTLIMIYFIDNKNESSPKKSVIFGLLVGVGLTLKIDILFYSFIPVVIIIQNSESKFRDILCYIIGVCPAIVMILINDYIKLGYLSNGYKDAAQTSYYVLFENLFAPSGNFSTVPLYLVLFFVLMIISFKKKDNDHIPLIFLLPPFLEIIVESVGRIHQENFGARHWINDYFVFCYLFVYLYLQLQKRPLAKKILVIFVCMSFVVTLLKAYLFEFYYDDYFHGSISLLGSLKMFVNEESSHLISRFFSLQYIYEKMMVYPVLIASFLFLVSIFKRKLFSSKVIIYFSLITTSSYFFITSLNYFNNRLSSDYYFKKLMFNDSLVGNGTHINTAFENLGTYEKVLGYYKYKGNLEMIEKISSERSRYIKKAILEIESDPKNLKSKLLGSDKFIEDELRDD